MKINYLSDDTNDIAVGDIIKLSTGSVYLVILGLEDKKEELYSYHLLDLKTLTVVDKLSQMELQKIKQNLFLAGWKVTEVIKGNRTELTIK